MPKFSIWTTPLLIFIKLPFDSFSEFTANSTLSPHVLLFVYCLLYGISSLEGKQLKDTWYRPPCNVKSVIVSYMASLLNGKHTWYKIRFIYFIALFDEVCEYCMNASKGIEISHWLTALITPDIMLHSSSLVDSFVTPDIMLDSS